MTQETQDPRLEQIETIRKAVAFSEINPADIKNLASSYLDSLIEHSPESGSSLISGRRSNVQFESLFLRAVREGLILGSLYFWLEDKTLIEDYLRTKPIEDELDPTMFSQVRSDVFNLCQSL